MKKVIPILVLTLIMLTFCLVGCAPKQRETNLLASQISSLNSSLNNLADYNADYYIKKELKVVNAGDSLESIIKEQFFEVDASIKKSTQYKDKEKKEMDYYKLQYKGNTTSQSDFGENKTKKRFKIYNDKEKMYTYINGDKTTETDRDAVGNGFSYSKDKQADRLDYSFYNVTNIKTVTSYDMAFGKKMHLVQYSPDRVKEMFGYTGGINLNSVTKYEIVSSQCEFLINKNGYLCEQYVVVEVNITEYGGSTRKVKGTAKMELSAKYKGIGKRIKL